MVNCKNILNITFKKPAVGVLESGTGGEGSDMGVNRLEERDVDVFLG